MDEHHRLAARCVRLGDKFGLVLGNRRCLSRSTSRYVRGRAAAEHENRVEHHPVAPFRSGWGYRHRWSWRPRDDVPDWGARQLLDPMRKPGVKPRRDVRRKRGDDDLVVVRGIPRLDDRDQRIRVPDAPVDLESLIMQMFERLGKRLVRGCSPSRGRNDQRKRRWLADRSLLQRTHELTGGRGDVRHHKH